MFANAGGGLQVATTGGLTASFTLQLSRAAIAPVTVTMVPSSGAVVLPGGAQVTFAAGVTTQTVAVAGGPYPTLVAVIQFNLASSADPGFVSAVVGPAINVEVVPQGKLRDSLLCCA